MHRTLATFALCAALSLDAVAQNPHSGAPLPLSGLHAAAQVTRDVYGIAHVKAGNDHDLYFMQGYVHAQDRLFQMDVTRRQASGTLAELLGPAALAGDVELRTLGIRRAAERSLAVISPEARGAIDAYAEGVNAYVSGSSTLPPEYQAIEITKFEPWTALDTITVAKSITFSLSFDVGDVDNTIALQTYTAVFDPLLGPGTGLKLFSEDLWRSQPFYPASTVPDAMAPATLAKAGRKTWIASGDTATAELARRYAERVRKLPFFKEHMALDQRPGSNEWAVSGAHTASGLPLVANDPHLALGEPSTFYPIHLTAGSVDVMGSGFAGVPFVIVGQNRYIAWGATVSPLDVTDVFQEQVVPDPTSPSGLSTIFDGTLEHVVAIPESYRVNIIGDHVADDLAPAPPGLVPPVTLVVPRRNDGPIVEFDTGSGQAFSVQYTGFAGTREVDTFWTWNRARGLSDFERGLQWFASGTQNFAYADIAGNIAYYATSEVPIREDLQKGTIAGLPPWFIRSGAGGNEWLPIQHPQPGQAVRYEILPRSEMPHVVNPPAGWFVNANNDPAGTVLDNNPLNQVRPGGGIYYLNAGYEDGLRAGRITELLKGKLAAGPVSFGDMQAIQADVALPDAEFFVPFIVQAMARAKTSSVTALAALAGRSEVVEAVARLANWKFAAPTGIPEGYDAIDVDGVLGAPGSPEIAESVAATIYSVWRGQFIRNTIDATLNSASPLLPKPGDELSVTAVKALLERPQPGIGASGIDFFNAAASSAEDRRDIVILQSIADALERLAGPDFAVAFGGSRNQNDYRWGRLHRIVFEHPLGGAFDVPSANGAIGNPLGDALPGFPVDGGFGTVDASRHDPRAQSANGFMFCNGPVNRFVAEAGVPGVRARSIWPGGTSGVPGSPFYLNLLGMYLTNDTVPLLFDHGALQNSLYSVSKYLPAH